MKWTIFYKSITYQNWFEIEITNNPTTKTIRIVKKVPHKEKNSNNFTREFYQTFKKQIILILHQLFQNKGEKYIFLKL